LSKFIRGVAACVALQLFAAAPLQAAHLAGFRLQVEDLSGNSITSVHLGQDFKVAAYVEDIRDPEVRFPGVWAAYMNVAYDAGLVSITSLPAMNPNPGDPGNFGDPGIQWGSYFAAGLRSGDMSAPGQVNGIGSASLEDQPSGLGEILLWRITIHTSALGTVTFSPTFDSNQDHESSFINPPDALTDEQIHFIGDSIQIVPEPSSCILAALGLLALVVWCRRRQ
jgi:hypothetical protein